MEQLQFKGVIISGWQWFIWEGPGWDKDRKSPGTAPGSHFSMSSPSWDASLALLHLSSWATPLEKGHFTSLISFPKEPPLCSAPPLLLHLSQGQIHPPASLLAVFPLQLSHPAPVPSNLRGSSSSAHGAPGEFQGAAPSRNTRLGPGWFSKGFCTLNRILAGRSAALLLCRGNAHPQQFGLDLSSVGRDIFGCREPRGGTEHGPGCGRRVQEAQDGPKALFAQCGAAGGFGGAGLDSGIPWDGNLGPGKGKPSHPGCENAPRQARTGRQRPGGSDKWGNCSIL